MQNGSEAKYNKLANTLIEIEDKFSEIVPVVRTLNIWIKENDFELIPVMNILNNKINDITKIFEK